MNKRLAATASAVVFDGDDTLWKTEELYDSARAEARAIVSRAGLDGAKWEALERRLDLENVSTLGYSPDRFPRSCVQAYELSCREIGRDPIEELARRVGSAARSVFESEAQVMPDAHPTLAALRRSGLRLALMTKGDRLVQKRRVARSGLRDIFHVIRIVDEKSPAEILSVVSALGVPVERAWMVGNSMRSDVLPALAAGLRAIWINAHVWEHERSHDHLADSRAITLPSLASTLGIILDEQVPAQCRVPRRRSGQSRY
ncbi:MAG TPA: HAD family hydrolase [Polyangiaceae bacterium]|nr:HAD family hydrolase [Polyangiaceae bacterium]